MVGIFEFRVFMRTRLNIEPYFAKTNHGSGLFSLGLTLQEIKTQTEAFKSRANCINHDFQLFLGILKYLTLMSIPGPKQQRNERKTKPSIAINLDI